MTLSLLLALEGLRLFGAGFFYFAHGALAALGVLGAIQASLALALNPASSSWTSPPWAWTP